MKTIKLVSMAMLSMAMIMTSCSGEDGETGPQGPKGDKGDSIQGNPGNDGNDGIACWDLNGNGTGELDEDINNDGVVDALDCQGEQGEQGETGNANVQEHTFNLDVFGDYSTLKLDLHNIVDEPANYAYLYYLVSPTGVDDEMMIPIPGYIDNTVYTFITTFLNPNSEDYGTLNVFFRQNGAPFMVNGSPYPELIVVAIELSNTGKTSENVMAELKAAGVDTSDYDAVATYFGLK